MTMPETTFPTLNRLPLARWYTGPAVRHKLVPTWTLREVNPETWERDDGHVLRRCDQHGVMASLKDAVCWAHHTPMVVEADPSSVVALLRDGPVHTVARDVDSRFPQA